jgi:ATP/maltotriose-dependent transcriptional regulator MalT
VKTLRLLRNSAASQLREALSSGSVVWVESEAEADLVVRKASLTAEPGTTLTPREREMLEFLADGWANDEIADRLGITGHTVKFHLDGLYRKLGVGRRTEAVREGYRLGLLRL